MGIPGEKQDTWHIVKGENQFHGNLQLSRWSLQPFPALQPAPDDDDAKDADADADDYGQSSKGTTLFADSDKGGNSFNGDWTPATQKCFSSLPNSAIQKLFFFSSLDLNQLVF